MSGSAFSRTSGSSRSRSRSRGITYVTEHHPFREETGRQYWPLEEQWEKLIARLMNLDRREAVVKVFNRRAIDVETPEVRKLPTIRRPRNGRLKRGPQRHSEPPELGDRGISPDGLPEDFRE